METAAEVDCRHTTATRRLSPCHFDESLSLFLFFFFVEPDEPDPDESVSTFFWVGVASRMGRLYRRH